MKKKLVKKEAGVSLETKVDRIFGVILGLDEKFDKIDDRFDSLEKKSDLLYGAVDTVSKKFDNFEKEFIVMRHRLDMLETWAKKVSEKVGIPLPF